ncbi:prenyltransferase [Candidatus Litorirhabdus singularis]|nr:prenyltransferase [Candidatus Litorirhabdus singularis]
MPQLSLQEWQRLDIVARWLVATRASVLFMTLMSAALGGLLAGFDGHFNFAVWCLCALGLVMAHATNNLLNDYTDSRRGIDKDNYYRNQYGVHVLEDELLTPRQFWGYVAVTAMLALVPGLYLVWQSGGVTLSLLLAGAFFVLFYTWPLKYFGLGEPAVLLVWGPLMVGGTYYVLAGEWSWPVTWLSLLYALGPTSVLFGKHIDKLELDAAKRVHTLPVILGEVSARYWVCAMLMLQYLGTVALVLLGVWHWGLLLVLLNLADFKKLLQVFSEPKPAEAPAELPAGVWPLWFSAFAFSHTRRFTGLFLVGLLLQGVF